MKQAMNLPKIFDDMKRGASALLGVDVDYIGKFSLGESDFVGNFDITAYVSGGGKYAKCFYDHVEDTVSVEKVTKSEFDNASGVELE